MKVGIQLLGVGITYFPTVEQILKPDRNLVQVLEIEPQTIWNCSLEDSNKYKIDEDELNKIKIFDCPKIIHSVGIPIGGSAPPDNQQTSLLHQMTRDLKAPWVSEHLSFNKAKLSDGYFNTAFFLPPRQTSEGVKVAVRSISSLQDRIKVPIAVENGVNYLRPRSDELSDGEFVSNVIESADCGLVLDLHNLWTNQLNGRQSIEEFVNQIPLDRVWEVHLAGGSSDDDYWLDSHSGEIPSSLIDAAKENSS